MRNSCKFTSIILTKASKYAVKHLMRAKTREI